MNRTTFRKHETVEIMRYLTLLLLLFALLLFAIPAQAQITEITPYTVSYKTVAVDTTVSRDLLAVAQSDGYPWVDEDLWLLMFEAKQEGTLPEIPPFISPDSLIAGLQAAVEAALAREDSLRAERDDAVAERDSAVAENASLRAEIDSLRGPASDYAALAEAVRVFTKMLNRE